MALAGMPPAVTEETAPFWAAATEGRLVVERCEACGADSFPPRGICRSCRSRATGWAEVAGDYAEPGSFRSVADVIDETSLEKVRAFKKEQKSRKAQV